VVVVVGLALIHAASREVRVEPGSSCPRPQRVEALLAGKVHPPRGPWRVRYRLDEAVLELELVDPAGEVRATRRMRVPPSECEAAAVAVAAVVERFFRDVGWTAGTPLPAVATEAAPPRRLDGGVTAGASLWVADAVRPQAAVGAQVGLGPNRLGLGVLLPGGTRTLDLAAGATVSERVWPLRVSLARLVRGGRLAGEIGPDALFVVGDGRSEGITSTASGMRLVFSLGAAAAVQVPLGAPGWGLTVQVAGYRLVAGRRFRIDGASGRFVLDAPRWQALAGMGIVRAF
jgi:hypothetical protein